MVEQASNQTTNGGSIPTPSLQFSPCLARDIKLFVEQHHYSKTCAGANDLCFRADLDGRLVGACVFGFMGGKPKDILFLRGHDNQKHYRELRRLVLLDESPKNSESLFIGWCIRYLKKNTDLIALISFADPEHGHVGGVYQATNWIYTGYSSLGGALIKLTINGKRIHPRTAWAKYGTFSLPKLRTMGLDVKTEPLMRKYRYVYLIRSELRSFLKLKVYPYPKKACLFDTPVIDTPSANRTTETTKITETRAQAKERARKFREQAFQNPEETA